MRPIRGAALAAVLGVAALQLGGCAGDASRLASIATAISAAGSDDPVARIYDAELGAAVASAGLERFDRQHGIGPRRQPGDLASATLRNTRAMLARLAEPAFRSAVTAGFDKGTAQRSFQREWRRARQTLYLAPAGTDSGSAPFAFSGLQADQVEIRVVAADGGNFRMRLICDGAMAVEGATGQGDHAAGSPFVVVGTEAMLYPQAGLNRCDADVAFAEGRRELAIVREELALPALARLDSRYDVCAIPPDKTLSPLERAFYQPSRLSQTCVFAPGRPQLLTDEKDGFSAKVAALLGTPLPERFFRDQDPEAPLDFSKAPPLSLVYVSYLDIKADFSGRVLERLLRHHAALGTTIRIVASDLLERRKDRAMLETLAGDYPNVQLKLFAFSPSLGAPLDEELSQFHRVHHTKMLAALSPQPGRSTAIIGGRNIHDGFLFDEAVDLSSYPRLQDYGRRRGLTLNYYSNWRDLDMALHDDAAVRAMAAHLSTLWHDDAVTRIARPFSVAVAGGRAAHAAAARHFISVPYSDGRALETYFVGLIDASRRSIEIVNPYLNLTPEIAAAIQRALNRGVAITIVGRIDLASDFAGDMLTALNEIFVEQNLDRIAIYDYRDSEVLLHAKVLMIDGELVTISSVNLNNRSFIHDNENGITVLDSAFYHRVKPIFEAYRKASVRVTEARVGLAWRLLFSSRMVREAF